MKPSRFEWRVFTLFTAWVFVSVYVSGTSNLGMACI